MPSPMEYEMRNQMKPPEKTEQTQGVGVFKEDARRRESRRQFMQSIRTGEDRQSARDRPQRIPSASTLHFRRGSMACCRSRLWYRGPS